MAVTNGYCTVLNVQERLVEHSAVEWDASEVEQLESVINAASRWIDNQTGRRFFSASETRYYTADAHDYLYIDDCVSVSALATDDNGDRTYSTTWTTSDYDLLPYNAQLAQPPRPYTSIEITPEGNESFPRLKRGVKVTAAFGYCTAANRPYPITEAAILLAMRVWKRKDALYGVAGAPALGVAIVQARITADGDILALIEPYKRSFF